MEVFARDTNRVRYHQGKKTIKVSVPNNRLFLSMTQNDFHNGDRFSEDGYVYNDVRKRHKKRKWFTPRRDWKHFWHPVLDQLPRIENMFFRLKQRSTMHWDRAQAIMRKIVKAGNPLPGDNFVAHYYDGGWHEYSIHDYLHYGHSLGRNALKQKPKKILNRKLGEALHDIDRKFLGGKVYWAMAFLLEEALIRKLTNDFPDTGLKSVDRVFEINVNGRKYFYKYDFDPHGRGGTSFQKIAWPLDKYEIVHCE